MVTLLSEKEKKITYVHYISTTTALATVAIRHVTAVVYVQSPLANQPSAN